MTTRRQVLGWMGVGAATAALGAPAVRETATAFASAASSAAAPWWLLSPLGPGASLGLGWTIAGLSAVDRGAAIVELSNSDGRGARVHLCTHSGSPVGIESTRFFDLVLMDGGQGDQRTPVDIARVLKQLGDRIRAAELDPTFDVSPLEAMLPHVERVLRYAPETLT